MAAAAAFRRLMWLTVGHGSMVTLSSDEAPSLSCYRTSTQVADAMWNSESETKALFSSHSVNTKTQNFAKESC